MFSCLDRWAIKAFGEARNPFATLGALSVSSILVAVVTGILLLPFYSTSVHEAYSSVAGMLSEYRFSLGILHSVHRYSSDAAMLFTGLHLLRTFFAKAFLRSRVLSWETGLFSMGLLWFVGWTGYWLVWDQTAFYVAQMSARMIDWLPIFGTYLEKGLLLNDSINNQFFFVVFFIHMIIPIGLFALLWIHVSRVNRPKFLIGKKAFGLLLFSFILMAAFFPGNVSERADPFALASQIQGDFFFLLPVKLFANFNPTELWSAFIGIFVAVSLVPYFYKILAPREKLKEAFAAPSVVDPTRCTGCGNCHNDCPYQAIEMRERKDESRHKLVAWVSAERCMSCGVCNGACDSNGNNLPWLSTDEIESRIKRWSPKLTAEVERLWLLFVCKGVADETWKVDSEKGTLHGLPQYRVIVVPCAGHVNPKSIKIAYEQGFLGVVIANSLPGACDFREGNQWIQDRVSGKRAPSGRMGRLDRERTYVLSFPAKHGSEVIRSALQCAGDANEK